MIDIYLLKITKNIPSELFSRLLEKLPEEEKHSVIKKVRKADKDSALITRNFTRLILCRNYNLDQKKIIFQKNKYGKPFLAEYSALHFNLSHSGNLITLAVSDLPVGIDIEQERDIEPDIITDYLSPVELEYYTQNKENKKSVFYKLWTLKESYIKAIGMGMYKELTSFSVVDSNGNINRDLPWVLTYQQLAANEHIAVCGKHQPNIKEIRACTLNEIVNAQLQP